MSTLPKLQTNHWNWIFSSAAEHFREQVEKLETELMRHERFKDIPIAHGTIVHSRSDRQRRMREIESYLAQYRDILTVLENVVNGISELNAEECAAQFIAMKKMEKREDKKASSIPV